MALIKNKEIQKIKIGKVVKINYTANGQTDVFCSFTGQPTKIFLNQNCTFEQLENASNAEAVRISAEKINDLKL